MRGNAGKRKAKTANFTRMNANFFAFVTLASVNIREICG